jgi:hypothetical protein
VSPSDLTRWEMLVPSTRLKDRLNPNCPSLLKRTSKERMREGSSRETPCALFRPSQFSENLWSRRDSWDRQAFQYFSRTSIF